LKLAQQVRDAGLTDPRAVVLFFEQRFFEVALTDDVRDELAFLLERELGSADVLAATSYAEDALRRLLHAMLSRPEYQLG
jgi:hypothetical protein